MAGPESFPRPEDLLTFVELDEFRADWEAMGLDVELDLSVLQWEIMENPSRGDLVPGAGGLRKMRFAPPKWSRGKRGAIRVCYVHFERHFLVLLMMAYRKGSKDDLSQAEKKGVARYLRDIELWLEHRREKGE